MYSRPKPSALRHALLGLALLAALPASATDLVTFSRGSLIIPEQATFQQGCGALSAYGLVWRILQANQANGPNASNPVTVYLAINDLKASPNRCVPTNRHTPPAPVDDPKWNDGCDFTITNTAEQPVVQVDYSAPFPPSGLYPYGDVQDFETDSGDARPYFDDTTLNNTVNNPRFSTVRYSGGAFIIDAQDAQRVIDFIRTGSGPESPAKFRTACGCDTFSNNSGCHYVRMHQATIEFTAPVARRINRVPPKIALLDLDDAPGDGRPSNGRSYVKGGMLDDYLRNAGLDFPGAGGCPEGTTSGCTLNNGNPGLIYDALHANVDLISTGAHRHGLLNAVDPVTRRPRYKVFWAPHWELGNSWHGEYQANGDGATTQYENLLNNIAYFTNQRGNGLFAECASIHSYETTRRPNNTPVLSSRFQGASNFAINPLGDDGDDWRGRNCTDPDYLAQSVNNRGQCMLYPNPGDPFSQMGDFRFDNTAGHTENYEATYKTGVRRLAVSWTRFEDGEQHDNPAHVADTGSAAATSSPSTRRTTTRRRRPSSTSRAMTSSTASRARASCSTRCSTWAPSRWAASAPCPRRWPSTTSMAATPTGRRPCCSRPPTTRCPATRPAWTRMSPSRARSGCSPTSPATCAPTRSSAAPRCGRARVIWGTPRCGTRTRCCPCPARATSSPTSAAR